MDYSKKLHKTKDVQICHTKLQPRSQGDGQEHIESIKSSNLENLNNEDHFTTKNKLSVNKFSSNNSESFIDIDSLTSKLGLSYKGAMNSIMSAPDPIILSSPPSDFNSKQKFLQMPTIGFTDIKKYDQHPSHKKKEPKFVPYEPYKGCVKPILNTKHFNDKLIFIENEAAKDKTSTEDSSLSEQKFKTIISDFEKERNVLEMENYNLKRELEQKNSELSKLNKDHSLLQQQLSTQSQVNSELKKLLVASVGEDVQGRVQCLTEDKARMATMIRKYSEKVDKDFEEKEKIAIQCDVWRSKFLASSLLIDELARWKGALLQRFQSAKEAINLMLNERDVAYPNLINSYKHIYQIQEAFDPLHTENVLAGYLESSDIVSVCVANANVSESVRDRLLGNLGKTVGLVSELKLPVETRTPGEKLALQVLEDGIDPNGILSNYHSNRSLLPRYHPNANFDKLTMNCCGKCNGDIIVI